VTRHLLRDDDLTQSEQLEILDLADALKRDPYSRQPLAGPQTVALLFDKNSTRTRVSFHTAVSALGGSPLHITRSESQLGGETVADTARVLERMVSAIVWRTYDQSGLEAMAAGTRIPVVNGLSDDFHPCQLLADLQTIREKKGELSGLTVTFIGDGSCNMAQSYALAGATAGMHIRIACPDGYQPSEDIIADARRIAQKTGGSVIVGANIPELADAADVIVTDTWVSMGREEEREERERAFGPYRVRAGVMSLAKPDAIFMHCLPAYRGSEVDADVIDGPQSVIWDETENRVHAQKALLCWLLEHGDSAGAGAR